MLGATGLVTVEGRECGIKLVGDFCRAALAAKLNTGKTKTLLQDDPDSDRLENCYSQTKRSKIKQFAGGRPWRIRSV